MDQLRVQITEEEHERQAQGPSRINKPGAFLIAAMEIEEQQYVGYPIRK
jgi:hypothetical protein